MLKGLKANLHVGDHFETYFSEHRRPPGVTETWAGGSEGLEARLGSGQEYNPVASHMPPNGVG